jgi:pilus assembly protein CpaE
MIKDLVVAIEIADSGLARSIMEDIGEVPDVQAVQWYDSMGEKGSLAVKTTPNIIIVDDAPESDVIFTRLSSLRQSFPQAAMFVVSTDKRPKHIVEVMKAGVAEYLVTPVNQEILQTAINDIRTKLATDGKIAKGTVYSFISSKGGLGATVIAVNTAAAVAKDKGAVALCDMSFQSGDSSVLLDIVPGTSFVDICKNFHRLDVSLLRGCMTKHESGLDFLAAPMSPEQSEDICAEHIKKTFELIKKLYDHIIVDCTSMFIDECTIEAFTASEKIFVVTDLSVPAIRNAARLFQAMNKLGINPAKVEFLVNRYIKGGTLSIEEVEKTLGKRIFWLFPNDFNDIVSSINRGVPLISFSPQAPFSKNALDFAKKLQHPHADDQYRGLRGSFGKAI